MKKMKVAAVGSGKIVETWLSAIADVEEIVCVALCVREKSKVKGEKLAEEFAVETLYTDFQTMLDKEEFDFVYIGIANDVHFQFAKQALESNKNVILEKPFTPTLAETQELISLAKERKLFLFEAITNLYVPMFQVIKDNLHNIGRVKIVNANFSQISTRYANYLAGDIHPVFDPKVYGGALYDINVYNIHLLVALFGEPKEYGYYANRGSNGIDTSGIVHMEFPQCTASAAAAKDAAGECCFSVQGEKGYIRSFEMINALPSVEVSFGDKVRVYHNDDDRNVMVYEFLAFRQMWLDDDYSACEAAMEQTVKVMKILDNLWRTLWLG